MRIPIIIASLLIAASASAQDSLKIISPNGGEKFLSGSDTVITWTGIPLTDTVKLEYSTDAGNTWNFITDTATGGHYPWHVPKTVSDSCLVRVEQSTSSIQKSWIRSGSRIDGNGTYNNSYAITTDLWNNIYITGTFQGTTTFDNITIKGDTSLENFFIAKYSSEGVLQWINQAGDKMHGQFARGRSLVTDDMGNVYVTGDFKGTTNFGNFILVDNGSGSGYIAKYDLFGNILWAKNSELTQAIAIDSVGNICIAAYGDGSVTKYNTDGVVLWSSKKGVGEIYPQGIAIDNLTNIFITGNFVNRVTLDTITLNPVSDFLSCTFIAKYNQNGNIVWAKSIGSTSYGEGKALTLDRSGNIYATGRFQGVIDFGDTTLRSAGGYDIFFAKYFQDGTTAWAKRAGSIWDDDCQGATLYQGGDVLFTGLYYFPADFDKDSLYGDENIFIANYHPTGKINWVKQTWNFGSLAFANGITVDNNNNIYITGQLNGKINFLGDTVIPKNYYSIYLWKIGRDPNLQPDTSDSLFSIIKPNTLLSIPNDSGYAGEHKNIPLVLKNAPISSVQSLATNFSARIAYDRTVLYPTAGSIQHGVRFDTVTFTGAISSDSAASGTLALLPFIAMLGESTFSPMKIVDFQWLDGAGLPADIDVATDSGTFYLLGICPSGGTRLYNPDGQVSMAHVNPNPANGIIHIEIQTTETGRTQLYLMNLLGQRVATISDGELKPGSHTFDFNSNQLSAGSYFVTFATPTVRRIERVDVEK